MLDFGLQEIKVVYGRHVRSQLFLKLGEILIQPLFVYNVCDCLRKAREISFDNVHKF